MIWVKASPYHLESGHYTIAKAYDGTGWLYTAFHVKRMLGTYLTVEEARERCREHEQARDRREQTGEHDSRGTVDGR